LTSTASSAPTHSRRRHVPAQRQQATPVVAAHIPAKPNAPVSRQPLAATFSELALAPELIKTLHSHGIIKPFPIQASTLPDALAGRDVLGRGQTGSGKTLAFGLALLNRTAGKRAQPRQPLTLILVPTRELAQQVTAELTPYAAAMRLRCATVVGGLSIGAQAEALRRGVEVLVATPGRLADLVKRGDCQLDQVNVAVVDEADQMADIGFLPQVTALLNMIPAGGQRMLFSATLGREVDRLVRRFLIDPVTHSVDPPAASVVTMTHHLLQVELADKLSTVAEIAARDGSVIMFVDTKRGADRLAKTLLERGVHAASLHGGKSQGQRTRALEDFRGGRLDALVATNVAARGIHIDDLDLVVNVDPPNDGKDYLHRSGRTARAGQSGVVVTIVTPQQRREVSRLMSSAGIRAACVEVHPGHPELIALTGARTPSGVPIIVPVVREDRPARRRVSVAGAGANAGGGIRGGGSRRRSW
jgi:superfamily II DNA/RNA helicase